MIRCLGLAFPMVRHLAKTKKFGVLYQKRPLDFIPEANTGSPSIFTLMPRDIAKYVRLFASLQHIPSPGADVALLAAVVGHPLLSSFCHFIVNERLSRSNLDPRFVFTHPPLSVRRCYRSHFQQHTPHYNPTDNQFKLVTSRPYHDAFFQYALVRGPLLGWLG